MVSTIPIADIRIAMWRRLERPIAPLFCRDTATGMSANVNKTMGSVVMKSTMFTSFKQQGLCGLLG